MHAFVAIITQIGINARCFHVLHVEIASFIVSDIAGIESFRAEITSTNNCIGCTATTSTLLEAKEISQYGSALGKLLFACLLYNSDAADE